MKLPDIRKFPAFAQAQAWGMAVGFALAWFTLDKLHFSFWAMLLGWIGSWIGWELLFARAAPSSKSDLLAIAYGIASGFAFPWCGFALAAILEYARP